MNQVKDMVHGKCTFTNKYHQRQTKEKMIKIQNQKLNLKYMYAMFMIKLKYIQFD